MAEVQRLDEARRNLIRSAPSENPIVNMIEGEMEKTVHETAVDPDSQYNPWNPDDLYQKEGNYSIYEDMIKDDQVSVAMAIKKDLIIGSGWHIACEEDEHEGIKADIEVALKEDIETPLDDALSNMLTAYEVGFSVSEKQFSRRDDGSLTLKAIKTRNPVSWLFHQDKFGNITRYEQQGATAEFSNVDPNSLIHFVNNPRYGNPYGTSDLRAAYAAYFIKKHIVRYYAIFLEKAASPIPVAKYDRNIALDAEIEKLHNTIKKFQASSALTIPKDLEVQFLEQKGNGEPYVRGIDQFNMFIGRALFVPDLLGFQGSETSGGSQALGREQMVIFFKHIMRRRRTIEDLINKHIVWPLVFWNHGFVDNYPKFKLNPIEEEQAENNARLWLEAVKGKVFKPTLEEVNHFKRIVDFPETSEEEWEEQKEDPIERAAAEAEIPSDSVKRDGEEKEATEDEKASADGGEKKEEFAKKLKLPVGEYHKKTDFRAIEKQLDGGLDLFLAKAQPILKSVVEKFGEKLKRLNINSAEKLGKMDRMTLPKAEVKKLQKLLDSSFGLAFDQAREMAQTEIFKTKYAVQPAPEFMRTLSEEDLNYINDWEYQLTKRAKAAVIAAVKDGKPISSVIEFLETEGAREAAVSLERYARTKFTEVMNKGRISYFESTGVVGAYQYSAILDGQTTPICRGLHGKVFKAGTEPVPPMHFNCRSLLIPITNFEEWKADEKAGGKGINDFIETNKGKGFARN